MLSPEALYNTVKNYYPLADQALILKAYNFSKKAHKKQKRESGEPYFLHPLSVAEILADLRLDTNSVITGLLHDTLEDTDVTHADIYENFGPEITSLVDGVTKLSRIELQSEKTQQAENFRKLLLAMSSDIRVLLVKLIDRLHNMRTLHHIKSLQKRHRIAHESLDIYCPLAERIGMNQIKEELEEIAFKELHAEMFDSIQSRLSYLKESSGDIINQIIFDLNKKMQDYGIKAAVIGRSKSAYSIWRKMQRKNVGFEQLSDIMAFRVIVDSIPACYQTLGAIHQEFSVIPGCIKDYISTPKSNGYQSIHTVIYGPYNHKIEIQLRSQKIHEFAEHGLAAHWRYKNNDQNIEERVSGRQYSWIRSLLDILDTADGMDEFLEHTKLEMFHDQVFCFTPHGRLISLPKGATPIDFAYAIHSDIGDKTIGAKIDGRPVPLRSILHNGDQIEILTDDKHKPSPTWERFVITGKARSAIRRYMKTVQKKEFLDLGKNLLKQTFMKEDVLFCEKALKRACDQLHLSSIQDLFVNVGKGRFTTRQIYQLSHPENKKSHFKPDIYALDDTMTGLNISPLVIKEMIPGVAINFSPCCHPIPGDDIIGVMSNGKGISIHTRDCECGTFNIDHERVMDLSWEQTFSDDVRFIVRLKVTLINKIGSLTQMLGVLSSKSANLINFKVTDRNESFWDVLIDFHVKDTIHLDHITAAINSLKCITYVVRV